MLSLLSFRFRIALLAATLCPLPVWAGSGGANISGGGNAMVCFDDPAVLAEIRAGSSTIEDRHLDAIRGIVTYDLYEALMARGLDHVMQPEVLGTLPDDSAGSYVGRIIRRTHFRVPRLARLLDDAHNRLRFLGVDSPLARIRDEEAAANINLEECTLATMAEQRMHGEGAIARIDMRLFNHPRHSTLSRAVLLLHEDLYFAARKLGHEDSRRVRAIISRLLITSPAESPRDLAFLATELGFSTEDNPVRTFIQEATEEAVRRMIGVAAEVFRSWQPHADRMLERLNAELADAAVRCDGDLIIPCRRRLHAAMHGAAPELSSKLVALDRRLARFAAKRRKAISGAMMGFLNRTPMEDIIGHAEPEGRSFGFLATQWRHIALRMAGRHGDVLFGSRDTDVVDRLDADALAAGHGRRLSDDFERILRREGLL